MAGSDNVYVKRVALITASKAQYTNMWVHGTIIHPRLDHRFKLEHNAAFLLETTENQCSSLLWKKKINWNAFIWCRCGGRYVQECLQCCISFDSCKHIQVYQPPVDIILCFRFFYSILLMKRSAITKTRLNKCWKCFELLRVQGINYLRYSSQFLHPVGNKYSQVIRMHRNAIFLLQSRLESTISVAGATDIYLPFAADFYIVPSVKVEVSKCFSTRKDNSCGARHAHQSKCSTVLVARHTVYHQAKALSKRCK